MRGTERGGAYGLREDCACLVIEIIICNHLPPASKSRGCSTQGDYPPNRGNKKIKDALGEKKLSPIAFMGIKGHGSRASVDR